MPSGQSHKIERIRQSLSLVKPIVTLSVGVVLPVLLSTAVGIVAIVAGESSLTLILGILVVSFTAAAIGGAVILYVLLGRRARLARLQSDLLANVTHELRTPLAGIRVFAQTLQTGLLQSDPKRAEDCLRGIVRETEWLDAMIDRVLSWRAAAKDRGLTDLQCGSIRPAVEEAAARFLRMVPPDEVALQQRFESAPAVRHDPRALGQAVLNLLVNAWKYSAAPKRIDLEVREQGGWAVITVEDNGIGIPTGEIRRIFEPFHRVKGAASGTSGAGLGLAIVHHVVKAHGGHVTVDTKEGEGSRFSINLPPCAPEEGRA
jgi:two-component system, OmpR family, phosphate regulon sensor histidine kinase PhoR